MRASTKKDLVIIGTANFLITQLLSRVVEYYYHSTTEEGRFFFTIGRAATYALCYLITKKVAHKRNIAFDLELFAAAGVGNILGYARVPKNWTPLRLL